MIKTYYIDLDCGELGDQDCEIKYTGNARDGIEILEVRFLGMKEELSHRIMGEYLDKIAMFMIKDMDYINDYWDRRLKELKEDGV